MTVATPMQMYYASIAPKFVTLPPVAGYVAWYDSSQITGFADGANLTSWTDQSGNGHTLTQFSTHTLPTYSTSSQINGNPTVHFSGSDCSITDNPGYGSPLSTPTVIVIGKNNQTPAYNFNWTDCNTATEVSMGGSSGGSWLIYAGSSVLTAGSEDTTAHFFAAVYNGASSAFYIDSGTASVTGNPGSNALQKLLLGNRQAADIGLNGLIGEVIVYSTALTAGNIASLHSYAQTKWGTP